MEKVKAPILRLVACTAVAVLITAQADLQAASDAEQQAELAKKLANPIASLISVPIQANYDENIGPGDEGSQWRINIQPVIPFSMGEDWNLISRTIVPVVDQNDIPVSGQGETGLGDIVASQFFSPKDPTGSGWIWGVGPVWLLPTATEDSLGSEKFGLGPTAVMLKQNGPWTYGALFNHIWSVAGEDERNDVNATFLQPFLAYVTKRQTTFGLNTESTYDWESEEWSVPINLTVAQLLKIGGLPVQLMAGLRYWADAPEGGADDWGARLQMTFLFPK